MSKGVIIYGKKLCTQCSQVKLFLELNSIPYEYLDIEDSSDAVLVEVMEAKQTLGISTLPFIKFKGEFLDSSGLAGAKKYKDLLCSGN